MSEVVSQPNRTVVYLAQAGIVGPVLYTVTWLVLGFLDPTYNHLRNPISNLSAIGAPNALVMTSVIFVFALLIIMFAYGLHRGLPPGFWGGPVALAIAGVGYVGIALAPLDLASPGDTNVPHAISASVTVFALLLAPVLLFWRLRQDPEWRNLGVYSIATTMLALVFAVMASAFAGLEGLTQRLVTTVLLAWMLVIAIRLYLRVRP